MNTLNQFSFVSRIAGSRILLLLALMPVSSSVSLFAADTYDTVFESPTDDEIPAAFESQIDTANRVGATTVTSTLWEEAKAEFLKGYSASGGWTNGAWQGNGMNKKNWGTSKNSALDVYYVRTSGSDSNKGNSAKKAFRTIAYALANVPAHSVIVVGAGVYQHTATIDVGTTNTPGGNSLGMIVYGDTTGYWTGDAGNVVVRNPKGVNDWTLRYTLGSGVIFSGITFEEDPTSKTTDWPTSHLDWTQYLAAGNQDMLGIYIDRGGQFLLHNCTFTGFRHALYLSNAHDIETRDCKFSNSRYMHAYAARSGKVNFYRCAFNSAAPKPYTNVLYHIYGWQSRMEITSCSFAGTGVYQSHGDSTAYNDRIYQYGICATAVGSDVNNAEANMGYVSSYNCTFTDINYIGLYGEWLRYFRAKGNTYNDVRYGSHGHGEDVWTRSSSYTQSTTSPWRNVGQWSAYQKSYTTAVRAEYAADLALRKKTTGVTPRAVYRDLSFTNNRICVYVGSDTADFQNITIVGNPETDASKPTYNPCYGIYSYSNGTQVTVDGSKGISFADCYWAVCGAGTELVLQNIDIASQIHGVNWSSGALTIKNSKVRNCQGYGVAASSLGNTTLTDSEFTGNSRVLDGHWNAYFYGNKTPRTPYVAGAPFDWRVERDLYGTLGEERITISNCKFNDSPKGNGLLLYWWKNQALSSNQANNNYNVGVQFADCQTTLNKNAEFSVSGNQYGIYATGYWDQALRTGTITINNYSVTGNLYNIIAGSTNVNINDTRVSDSKTNGIGLYMSWSDAVLTNVESFNNYTGIQADAMHGLIVDGANCHDNASWGMNGWIVNQYDGAVIPHRVEIENGKFEANKYGGLALGSQNYVVTRANGVVQSAVWTEGYDRFNLHDIQCNANQHYGLYMWYCWLEGDSGLNIEANNNGTPQVGTDGKPVYVSGTIQERNWAVGIYPYKIGTTLTLYSKLGITAEGNSRWGWLTYYNPVEIDNMEFQANGHFGYNPSVSNGHFWGWGYAFGAGYCTSVSVANTTAQGGISLWHCDAMSADNLQVDGAYTGLELSWGWTDTAGVRHQPQSFDLANCRFSNGWNGFYQSAYEGSPVPISIRNVEATNNRLNAILTQRSPVTVRNLTSTGNGQAGLYCYDGNVDLADSNITGNATLTYEDGTLRASYGALLYCWERPYTYTVANCDISNNDAYGLYIGNNQAGASTTVTNVRADGSRYYGIYAANLPSVIEGCTADGGRNWGIVCTGASSTINNTSASNNSGGGGGIYIQGRYRTTTDTNNGSSTTLYHADQGDTATFTNCTTNNNSHSGIYATYCGSTLLNCQANGNTYYGFHVGYDDEAQSTSSLVKNCSASDNRSIGLYGYDTRLVAEDCTFNRNGYGLYHYSPATEPDSGIVTRCNMTNGTAWGLITNYEAMTVVNSHVDNNTAGGALFQNGTSESITDCSFNGNGGMGLYAYRGRNTLLERSLIQNNRSYGVYSWEATRAVAKNCVITGNEYGVLMDDAGGGSEMWNCTIAGSKGYIGFRPYRGSVVLKNSVVADNTRYGIYNDGLGSFTHVYNLVHGHAAGTDYYQPGRTEAQVADATEIRKSPRFMNAAGGDYRLGKGSPAINAGLDAAGIVSADILGNARPMFGRYEIGAYEYTDKSGSVRIMNWEERK